MKIHSDFKDYYDPVLKVMQTDDDGINYVRKTEEILLNNTHFDVKKPNNFRNRYFEYHWISVIGFCGKIYYCVHLNSKKLYTHIDNETLAIEIPKYIIEERAKLHYSYGYFTEDIGLLIGVDFSEKSRYGKYFKNTFQHPFNFEGFFEKYKTACFSFGISYNKFEMVNGVKYNGPTYSLKLNPVLKDYDFQRVMDPNSAIQELRMYFSSIITSNNTPVMPVGDDKVIAASKGFDKWSFRKMPTRNIK